MGVIKLPCYSEEIANRPLLLTPRERQILDALLVDGPTDKELSASFGIAEITVSKHVEAIFRKTGCTRRTELIAKELHRRYRGEN
jgi:DNA-binding NarL/FixJ family response regulator